MYKIDTPGAVAGAIPVPAAVGATVGWFQPIAGGGTGTVVSADWLNAVQAELIAIPAAAGIALDKTQQGQILAALRVLFGTPSGQCQLQYSSNVALQLMPLNGNQLKLNGKTYAVPAGGVAIANTGIRLSGVPASNLAASTDYLLYAVDDGAGNIVPDFWPLAGGHMSDPTAGNIGVEVRSNAGVADSTRSLIGLVGTDAGAHFSLPLTRSWFSPAAFNASSGAQSGSTSSNSNVEASTAFRVSFMCFARDLVILSAQGTSQINNTSETDALLGLDGAAIGSDQKANFAYAFTGIPFSCIAAGPLGEGRHTASLFGRAGSGGTATFTGIVQVTVGR